MNGTGTTAPQVTTYVIPCGGQKADSPSPARNLYTGSMFRQTLAAAEAEVAWCNENGIPARVLILSALYGLVELDTVISPYDVKMGQDGSVTPDDVFMQALALGIDQGQKVYGLLPKAYLRVLNEALRIMRVHVQNVYEDLAGIGEQKHVNSVVMAA